MGASVREGQVDAQPTALFLLTFPAFTSSLVLPKEAKVPFIDHDLENIVERRQL